MKAHAMRKQPERVLAFGIDEAAQPRLSAVLRRLAMEERRVLADETGQDVGYLAGLPGFAKKEAPGGFAPPGGGVLCLCGLSSTRMDLLLRALRENGISAPIKAVVTPVNQHWSFRRLVEELVREHKALAGGKGAPPPVS